MVQEDFIMISGISLFITPAVLQSRLLKVYLRAQGYGWEPDVDGALINPANRELRKRYPKVPPPELEQPIALYVAEPSGLARTIRFSAEYAALVRTEERGTISDREDLDQELKHWIKWSDEYSLLDMRVVLVGREDFRGRKWVMSLLIPLIDVVGFFEEHCMKGSSQ
jgi:hypothetical protein